MKSKRFRMMTKPVKPTKKRTKEVKINLYGDESLASILSDVPENVDNNSVCFHTEGYCNADCCFEYTQEETDAEFAVRLEQYKKDLKKYNEWYSENKEEVERILSERKVAEDKKRNNN